MVSYGRVELLSHELSLKYLQMKWNAYGKYINLAQLILYSFYLAILTSFAASIVVHDNDVDDNLDKYRRHMRTSNLFNDTFTSSPLTSVSPGIWRFYPPIAESLAHSQNCQIIFKKAWSVFD